MPMIAKGLLAAAATVVAVAALAPAAGAHATFVGVAGGVPADTDQALVVHVPHERDDTHNVGVVVAMPDGWRPLACEAQPTWTCALATADGRQTVQFTKTPGSAPADDEDFAFTVHSAPVEGTFAFPTVQTYSSGEVVRWISAEGSDTPAPRLLTTAAPATTAAPTASTAPATTAPSTSTGPGTTTVTIPAASSTTGPTTATSAPATTAPATPTTAPDDADDADDDGSGGGWLWLALIAVGVAAVAAGVYGSRRSRRGPSTD